MKLKKRKCKTRIKLIPYGADLLKIIWDIGGDHHVFRASSAVSFQFSSFVEAIYQLYYEEDDRHHNSYERKHRSISFFYPKDDPSLMEDEVRVESHVWWEGEGPSYDITFSRKCKQGDYTIPEEGDLIEIKIEYLGDSPYFYIIDGRELCYATAKACTEAIKKHGFYGYFLSTGGNSNGYGDYIHIHMLLFIKAYALNAMEVRKTEVIWKSKNSWPEAVGTSFKQELELFLFDM